MSVTLFPPSTFGSIGPTGPTGPSGTNGTNGTNGINGAPGIQGPAGSILNSKTVLLDFGPVPTANKTFTIIDADVLTTSKLITSIKVATSQDADENEMNEIHEQVSTNNGSFQYYTQSQDGAIHDVWSLSYLIG